MNTDSKKLVPFQAGYPNRYVEKTRQQWLGSLIPDLPDFPAVIDDLRPKISLLIS